MPEVIVDADRCVAGGQCVMAAPDVFDQDEDTGTVVLLDRRPPPALRSAVLQAARLCPALAIKVDES